MKIYIILFYFIQVLFLAYIFEWHIPIRLKNVLFRVVGGFPNFVHSQYFDLTNSTYPLLVNEFDTDSYQIFSSNRIGRHTWECSSVFGEADVCYSTVSEKNCRPNGQYSYEFWKASNNLTRCMKADQEVICANATISGNKCHNIAGVIHMRKSSTLIELIDENVGEVVIQKILEVETENVEHACYESHDSISMSNDINTIIGDEKGGCNKGILRARFAVNSTETCLYDFAGNNCSSAQHKLLEWWRNLQPNYICNCGSCKVPYLEHSITSLSLNLDDCVLPLESQYLFTFYQGSIRGVVNKLIWSAVRPSNLVAVKKKIAFLPLKTSSPLSRFQAKRGRFHCPADSGCWRSFFYIFGKIEEITWTHQIALMVIAMILTVVIVKQKPVRIEYVRKFPFAYFPGYALRETEHVHVNTLL